MTKIFVTEEAVEVAKIAMSVHGSYGLMQDYKMSQIWKDVIFGPQVEGGSPLLKVLVAGRFSGLNGGDAPSIELGESVAARKGKKASQRSGKGVTAGGRDRAAARTERRGRTFSEADHDCGFLRRGSPFLPREMGDPPRTVIQREGMDKFDVIIVGAGWQA